MDALNAVIGESRHPVKAFISSREDRDLSERYSIGEHLKVTALKNQEDIERFVLQKMDQSLYCQRRMQRHVREKVFQTFREKSDGM